MDDDQTMDLKSCDALLKRCDRAVLQEKVDGTNVGLHFEQDWIPVCQKRSGLILKGEHEQYVRFRDWVNENLEELWNALGKKYVLFGEWIMYTHGVEYDNLKSFFVAFDLYDKDQDCFLSCDKMKEIVGDVVEIVPLVTDKWNGDVKGLSSLVQKSKYSSKEIAEGLYIRFEKDGKVMERLKFRRKTFTAGRDDFFTNAKKNKLMSE